MDWIQTSIIAKYHVLSSNTVREIILFTFNFYQKLKEEFSSTHGSFVVGYEYTVTVVKTVGVFVSYSITQTPYVFFAKIIIIDISHLISCIHNMLEVLQFCTCKYPFCVSVLIMHKIVANVNNYISTHDLNNLEVHHLKDFGSIVLKVK